MSVDANPSAGPAYIALLEGLSNSQRQGVPFLTAWGLAKALALRTAAQIGGEVQEAMAEYLRDEAIRDMWRGAYANPNYGWLEAIAAI